MKRTSLLVLVFLLLTGCSAGQQPAPSSPGGAAPAALTISAPAFAPGQPIPEQYTCQGADQSPELVWSSVPEGTQSLALIVDDPDAPAGTWVHWVVYNLPPESRGLPVGASAANPAASAASSQLPAGAQQGKSSFNRQDYGGPCPPSGSHRYFFKLYALDTTISGEGLDANALRKAMDGHVLAQGELMGTYQKK